MVVSKKLNPILLLFKLFLFVAVAAAASEQESDRSKWKLLNRL